MNPNKKYLSLSKEQLEKLAKFKADKESSEIKVDSEWLAIAEFGSYFGYAGIEAILNNEIDIEMVQMLIAGQRKVWASQVVDMAQAVMIGAGSAQSKKPGTTFKKAIKIFTSKMKVDE